MALSGVVWIVSILLMAGVLEARSPGNVSITPTLNHKRLGT